jgi:hypothetical protein
MRNELKERFVSMSVDNAMFSDNVIITIVLSPGLRNPVSLGDLFYTLPFRVELYEEALKDKWRLKGEMEVLRDRCTTAETRLEKLKKIYKNGMKRKNVRVVI